MVFDTYCVGHITNLPNWAHPLFFSLEQEWGQHLALCCWVHSPHRQDPSIHIFHQKVHHTCIHIPNRYQGSSLYVIMAINPRGVHMMAGYYSGITRNEAVKERHQYNVSMEFRKGIFLELYCNQKFRGETRANILTSNGLPRQVFAHSSDYEWMKL